MNKAVFLDRDGIIIKMIYDSRFGIIDTPKKSSQIEFVPGIFSFLKEAKKKGYLLILISNQPGIGLKKISKKNHLAIMQKISRTLHKYSVTLDKEYYCLHHPFAKILKYRKKCRCRKPHTLLLENAVKDLNLDINKSWLVGDGVFDIMAGTSIGLKTIFVGNINEAEYLRVLEKQLKKIKPDFLVKNLNEASKILKKYG